MRRPRTVLLTAVLLAGAGGIAIAQQDMTTGATTNTPQQRSGSAERPTATSPGVAQSLNSNPASGPALPGGIGTPPAAAPGSPRTTPSASAPQP